MRKNIVKAVVSFFVTLIFLYFLLNQVKLSDIFSTLAMIPFSIILLAFFIDIMTYIARAFRYKLLFRKIGIAELTCITSVHLMFNGILPFRTGELSLFYLVSGRGIKRTKVLSTLLIVRMLDFLSIFFIFVFMVILTGLNDNRLVVYAVIVASISILGVVTLVFMIKYFHLFKIKKLMKIKPYNFLILKAEEVLGHFKELGKPKKIAVLGIVSVLLWIINYLEAYVVIYSLGINIGISNAVVAFTFITLMSIIPVSGLLNFGTLEIGWALAFIFFGVNKELAISSGFAYHILNIVYLLILGVLGFAFLKFFYSPRTDRLSRR